MSFRTIMRGGGDLGSGVALRLWRAGWQVLITETAQPMVVRRSVAFAQAVFTGEVTVEGVVARRISNPAEAEQVFEHHAIPVLIDPTFESRKAFSPPVVVDARMMKRPSDLNCSIAPLVIGLGPGFQVGRDCHAVVETNRGPFLGRVYWQGEAESDTGVPGKVGTHESDRVLRAPAAGVFHAKVDIGDIVDGGQLIGIVAGQEVRAPFKGLVRGLLYSGLSVEAGAKIGDIDPRLDPQLCSLVSEKALAIAGGVLEAILSYPPLRPHLFV